MGRLILDQLHCGTQHNRPGLTSSTVMIYSFVRCFYPERPTIQSKHWAEVKSTRPNRTAHSAPSDIITSFGIENKKKKWFYITHWSPWFQTSGKASHFTWALFFFSVCTIIFPYWDAGGSETHCRIIAFSSLYMHYASVLITNTYVSAFLWINFVINN